MRNISILLSCLALVFGGFVVGANAKNLPVSLLFFNNESSNYKTVDGQVCIPLDELAKQFDFLSIEDKIVDPAEIYSDITLKELIKIHGAEKYQPFRSIHINPKDVYASNDDVFIEVRVMPFDYRYNSVKCYWVRAQGRTIDLLPERTTYDNPKPSCYTLHGGVHASTVYSRDQLNLDPRSELASYPYRLPWEGFIVPHVIPQTEDTSLIFTYKIDGQLKTISVKL
ncbi:MAG TPA: hypothetical protein DCY27_10715 [Desulfobacterales bacterium]|nr:hypothetical protein [Desulfobacterales bacterium]